MTHKGSSGDSQLHSLERWRTSALDHAQTEHAQKQQVADTRAQAVDRVQLTIDTSQDMARSHMSIGNVLSVDSLTRIRHFAAVQSIELQQAAASLAQSRQAVVEAHTAVCRKFEELSVVERLRARRADEAAMESSRKEQRSLDDQASLRATRSSGDRHKSTTQGGY